MAEIMMERVIPWCVNGEAQHPFMCTPEHLGDLAYGHLFTQCGIQDPADILAVDASAEGISVTLREGAVLRPTGILERLQACVPSQSTWTVSAAAVQDACMRLLSDETYFGTHRLMLRWEDREVFREDVGRHNAADKCIAHGLQSGWDLSACMLGSTGRISLEMLAKAAVMGIPVFFSSKYPSDIAIEWAERLGVAIVARAHKEAAAVYGAAWRIT